MEWACRLGVSECVNNATALYKSWMTQPDNNKYEESSLIRFFCVWSFLVKCQIHLGLESFKLGQFQLQAGHCLRCDRQQRRRGVGLCTGALPVNRLVQRKRNAALRSKLFDQSGSSQHVRYSSGRI